MICVDRTNFLLDQNSAAAGVPGRMNADRIDSTADIVLSDALSE